jgi:DNA-binding LytR/AlgR family response regulator
MSKIKCIIIEDEPLAVKVLSDYVSQVPFLQLQKTFKDAILATEYLRDNTTDLIFLDIHLPKLKGMAFLKTLPDPPAVIVTTAYHQYERFLSAVNKVRKGQKEKQEAKDFIFVNVQNKKVKILFSDIVYIESQREYVKIVTTKKAHLTKMSTHTIESLLPPDHFKRIHRSFIISMDKIESYTAETVEVNGVSIPVGRGYRSVIEDL